MKTRLQEYCELVKKQYLVESASAFNSIDNTTLGTSEITEDTNHRMVLKGVLCTVLDECNINGRIYTTQIMQEALDYARKRKAFENRRFLCAADDHPVTDFVPPSRASHIILDSYIRPIGSTSKNGLFSDILILDTSNGKDLRALVESGASLGTSIRGFGNMNPSTSVVEDYEFVGFDFVGDPSAGTYSQCYSNKCTTESCEVDTKCKLVESKSVNTQIKESHSASIKENTTMAYDIDLELLKLEQRYKGQSLNESSMRDLVTIKNKAILENNMSADAVESNPVYIRLMKESVEAIRQSGVAQVEKQLKEATATVDAFKSSVRTIIESAQSELKEANDKLAASEKAYKEAVKYFRDLQKSSGRILEATATAEVTPDIEKELSDKVGDLGVMTSSENEEGKVPFTVFGTEEEIKHFMDDAGLPEGAMTVVKPDDESDKHKDDEDHNHKDDEDHNHKDDEDHKDDKDKDKVPADALVIESTKLRMKYLRNKVRESKRIARMAERCLRARDILSKLKEEVEGLDGEVMMKINLDKPQVDNAKADEKLGDKADKVADELAKPATEPNEHNLVDSKKVSKGAKKESLDDEIYDYTSHEPYAAISNGDDILPYSLSEKEVAEAVSTGRLYNHSIESEHIIFVNMGEGSFTGREIVDKMNKRESKKVSKGAKKESAESVDRIMNELRSLYTTDAYKDRLTILTGADLEDTMNISADDKDKIFGVSYDFIEGAEDSIYKGEGGAGFNQGEHVKGYIYLAEFEPGEYEVSSVFQPEDFPKEVNKYMRTYSSLDSAINAFKNAVIELSKPIIK